MTSSIRWTHFPYCIQRQSNGKYVILNRDYKPLGFDTKKHLDYLAYPIDVKFKRFTKMTAAKLSCKGSEDLEAVLLYDDGCVPTKSVKNMKAYLKRLEILAKLKTEGK